jgi:chorismate mutase
MVRGIRGAVTVDSNTAEAIQEATKQVLTSMVECNQIRLEDIASAFFTGTTDLDVEVPARAARDLGWTMVPMFCMQEMVVKGSLPRCIRVMLHVNTDKTQEDIQHIYLGEAALLRPDLVGGGKNGSGNASSGHRGTEGTRS